MISAGLKLKISRDGAFDFLFVNLAGAESVDADADRIGMADGVGELHFAAVGQAGRDHILRHPASHVSRAAVDFARVLSRKRAAAVPSHSAVGIDDDLAARDASVAFWSADHETAGGIDQVSCSCRRAISAGITFLMSNSISVSRISFCFTSAACCVETTTADARSVCGLRIRSRLAF